MTKHTAGPWKVDTKITIRPAINGTYPVADCNFLLQADEANARRIVECVNALEGLNPSAIRELVEAGEQARNIVSNIQNSPTLSLKEIWGYLMEAELVLRSALDKIKEMK